MERIRLTIHTVQKNSRAGRQEMSPASLLFLFSGVVGILFVLDSVTGVTLGNSAYLLAAFLCFALWAIWKWIRQSSLKFSLLAVVSVGLFLFSREYHAELGEQLAFFAQRLSGEETASAMELTQAGILFSAAASLLVFIMECVWKLHLPLYLLTTAVLVTSPLWTVRITAPALLALLIFQISFWTLYGSGGRDGKRHLYGLCKTTANQKSSRIMALALIVGFVVLSPLIASVSGPLYEAAYEAEGMVSRTVQNLSGVSKKPVTGGQISSGNNYRTGTIQLELEANVQPTEPIYLRGFGGGEYIGGGWIRSSDEALFEQMEETLEWENWASYISSMYYSMYFVMNENMLAEEPPEPIRLTISHSSGSYENAYVPYYSQRTGGRNYWYGEAVGQTADFGYTYEYYEQKDMNIDWENVMESFSQAGGWYQELQEAYMLAARDAYTQVPMELVPQLAALVEENPLTELNEITAFILYTLQSRASYSLTPGWTPVNRDIVEYFLFERGSGYCVHFAAAATLMYRLYGVTARYASGYMVSPDAFTMGEDGLWHASVTDESAHAWAEIFLPEYGWTPVEVTPDSGGSMAASYPGFDADLFSDILAQSEWNMGTSRLHEASLTEENTAEADFFPEFSVDFDLSAHRDWFFILGSVMVYTLLLTPMFLDYRRLRRLRKLEQMDIRMLFGQLLKLLHFCGKLVGYDGNEPEFPVLLAESIPGLSTEDAGRLSEQVRYAAYGPETAGVENTDLIRRVYWQTAAVLSGELTRRERWIGRYIKALF